MPLIGDVVPFIDANGVRHNLIVGAVRDDHPHHISGIYVDEDKAAQVFNTGAWEDSVVRVVDAVSHDHESKDAADPRNCWVRDVPLTPVDQVVRVNVEYHKEADVATQLQNAGPAPEETKPDQPPTDDEQK